MFLKILIRKINSKLSMQFVNSNFLDIVNGRMVNNYVDCYGNKFMAQSTSPFGMRIQLKK